MLRVDPEAVLTFEPTKQITMKEGTRENWFSPHLGLSAHTPSFQGVPPTRDPYVLKRSAL